MKEEKGMKFCFNSITRSLDLNSSSRSRFPCDSLLGNQLTQSQPVTGAHPSHTSDPSSSSLRRRGSPD